MQDSPLSFRLINRLLALRRFFRAFFHRREGDVTDRAPHPRTIVTSGAGAAKNPSQRIIISGRNGVEFVIMTTRTGYRLPQKRAPNPVDLMVNHIRVELPLNVILQGPRADGKVSGSNDQLASLRRRLVWQQVARNLFVNESVQRLVGIKGRNDIIPITPRIANQNVALNIGQISITGKIKPMASPVVAKSRRIK